MAQEIIFLVDSNIWLERLLDQEKSNDVKQFLNDVPSSNLAISDFSLHSIGVILFHLKKEEAFTKFTTDIFRNENVQLLSLSGMDHVEMPSIRKKFKLDFDDSYQYLIAKKYKLKIVSFDKDFLKTDGTVLDPVTATLEFKKL